MSATASKTQKNGHGRPSKDHFGHEVVGTFRGCTFDISTAIPTGTFRLDGRVCQPLRAGMSSIDFLKMLNEHAVLNITFAWDIREMAREVFHLLAIGFESNKPTTIPHTVV